MIARKAVQFCLLKIPEKTVKDLVAEGFAERQWIREQKRQANREAGRIYAARRRAQEALAKRSSAAITSSMEAERAKLPKTKAVGGNS